MNSVTINLINDLLKLIDSNSTLINVIKNPNGLVKSLRDLDKLIEMYDIKNAIVQQVQVLLVLAYHRKHDQVNRFESHKLHTIITGPPGVGKTKIAYILADIWNAIGVLDELKKEESDIHLPELVEVPLEIANETTDILKYNKEIYKNITDLKNIYIPSVTETFNNLQNKLNNSEDLKISHLTDLSIKTIEKWNTLNEMTENIIKNGINIINLCTKDENNSPKSYIEEHHNDPICVATRENLVGEYQGHTAIKCRDFLNRNKGKVIVLDEFYNFYHDDKDQFGLEALTIINTDMTEGRSHIYICAGYEKLMHKTVFLAQPGLKRRFQYQFKNNGYTAYGLGCIFKIQIEQKGWKLDESIDIEKFFAERLKDFPAFGGDTERLERQCEMSFGSSVFKLLLDNIVKKVDLNITLTINYDILLEAFEIYKLSRVKDEENSPVSPPAYPHMYS